VLTTSRFLLILIICVASSSATLAQIENSSGDYTMENYDHDARQWHNKVIVDSYKETTQDKGKARKLGIEFLETFANQYSKSEFTHDKLIEMANASILAGSRDPLLISYYLQSVRVKKPWQAQRLYADMLKAIDKKSSFGYRFAHFKLKTLQLGQTQTLKRSHVNAELANVLLRLLEHKDLSGRRFIYKEIALLFPKGKPIKEGQKIIEVLSESKDADPWLVNMFIGGGHYRIAWDTRGGGYAGTVNEDAWEKFYEHIEIAHKYYKKAHQLRPEFPEGADHLIGTTRDGASSKHSERYWFDQACKAQFDYTDARASMMWSLRPRWGGSVEKTLAFGLECAATERYDTDMPHELILAIIYAYEDGVDVLGREPIYQALKKVCKGYLDYSDKQYPDYFNHKSWLVAAAGKREHLADLKFALEDVDGELKEYPFGKLNVNRTGILSRLTALSGSAAPIIEDINDAFADGDIDAEWFPDLLEELKEAREKMPEAAQPYVDSVIANADTASAFESGQWAELKFDSELSGWQVFGGNWKAEESGKSIVLTDKKSKRAQIKWRYPVEFPIAIEVDVEHIRVSPEDSKAGIIIGTYYRNSDYGRFFFADPKVVGFSNRVGNEIIFGCGKTTVKEKTKGKKKLRLHIWKNHYLLLVNNHFIMQRHDESFSPHNIVGLGDLLRIPQNQTVRFSNFRVRKFPIPVPLKKNAKLTKYWDQWLEVDPDNSYALYRRGLIRGFKDSDPHGAIADLEASLKLDPLSLDCQFKIGVFSEKLGDFEKAKATYLKILESSPEAYNTNTFLAYLEASCSVEKLRDSESAIKRAKLLHKLHPTGSNPMSILAAGLAAKGDFQEAVKWQKKVLEIDPKNKEQKNRLELYKSNKPWIIAPGPRLSADQLWEKTDSLEEKPIPVVIDGLIARWPFDGNVDEVHKNNPSRVYNGDGEFLPGKIGESFHTNKGWYVGVEDAKDFGNFSAQDSFSYGGWFFPIEVRYGELMGKIQFSATNRGNALGTTPEGHLSFRLTSNGMNGDQIMIETKFKYKTRRWQHIFATYDGSGKATGMKIYINGKVAETKITSDGLAGSTECKSRFSIGGNSFIEQAVRSDECRIYDRALTPEEVAKVATFPAK